MVGDRQRVAINFCCPAETPFKVGARQVVGFLSRDRGGVGSPVFVIHRAGGGFDQGLEFTRPLIGNGFRVIAPSSFGYLRTPLPQNTSPEAQADARACLLDVLKLDKVAVFGGPAGAPSAMQLCLRHPERCSAMILGV